jgi:putative phage-type endonuclease
MITDKQREARTRGLGSSDMAAIFGVSRWKSPVDVWAEKTGRVATQQDYPSEAAKIGSAVEPALLAMASERLGRKVCAPSSTFVRGFLRANVDGMLDRFERGADIVEAKCHGQPVGYGADGSSAVPEAVMLQVQHQMLCADSQKAYVAVLDGQRLGFALYEVPRDEGYCLEIEARATEWWEKHILADVQPEGSFTLDTAARVTRQSGAATHIPSEIMEAYIVARESATAADRALDNAKAMLITALGQAEMGAGGGWRVSYRERSRSGVDTKRLLAENPELAERYATRTNFRVLDARPEGGRA